MGSPTVIPFGDFEAESRKRVDKPHFKFMTFDNAIAARPQYRWLIENLIPEKSFVVLASPPKVGKSFLVTDWCFHVSVGDQWGDMDVKQGGVLYLAQEGAAGFAKRIMALNKEKGLEEGSTPFVGITDRINLLDPDHVKLLIEDGKRHQDRTGQVSIIAIDTVHRSMRGGDENSGKDMGLFIDNVDNIREQLDCTAICVHHTGKDATKGMRGHTSLAAAADTVIQLDRDESKLITATVVYQKDGEGGQRFPFRLRRVVVGEDERGREISTCIVVRAEDEVRIARSANQRLKGPSRIAYQLLVRSILDFGTTPSTTNVPKNAKCVDWKKWKEACGRGGLIITDDQKQRDNSFSRSSRYLLEKGLIGFSDPWVWIADANV